MPILDSLDSYRITINEQDFKSYNSSYVSSVVMFEALLLYHTF